MSEIKCIDFFQISDLTFVAPEFKILFLQCMVFESIAS